MIYKLFLTENGVPKTGLTPTWSSLKTLDSTDKLSSAPTIQEIGGGWYKFSVTFGTAPFNVTELVGVIDAGSSLSNYERYIPITISLRDLSLTKLVNIASYDLVSGVESIRNDDDTANEIQFTLSQTGNTEFRRY
jgi:hypothetical protein